MASHFRALFWLWLCFHPLCSLAQFGPFIDVPTEVVAGTPAVATILPLNLYNNDPQFVSSYTVYLTASATSGRLGLGADFLQEQCFLAQNISVCDPTITIALDHVTFDNTAISFSIPPSVGPDGANYGISVQLFQTDGSRYSTSTGSNIFNLSSATGNWSHSQLADLVLSSPDTIPCASFACVKNCADTASNVTYANDTWYRNCAEMCPGVTIPLAQGEAASTTTASPQASLITYTDFGGETISSLSRMAAPVCTAITSEQSGQASKTVGSSTSTSTSTATSTGAAASSTKSSAANRLLGIGDRAWLLGVETVGICALLGWAAWY